MRRSITTSADRYKLALAISMGGMLELYDFLIYGLMASYIARNFFPAGDTFSALLGTFATFAVGYLTRPLGGIVFGHLGDRYGRKTTFTLSMFMMATSTALMGCLPTYSIIGIMAPLLLVLLRLIQGFSLGGEVPGAITYLSESAPERQGLVVGILFMSLMTGIAFGTFVHGTLTLYLDEPTMLEWGWRIPFWLGGTLGIVSYQVRKRFNESGLFMALDQVRQRTSQPLLILVRQHPRGLICGLLIMALSGATVTTYGVYMPSYLSSLLGFPRNEVAWHTALAFLVLSPVCVLGGLLTDLINRKWLFLLTAVVVISLSWPSFQYFISDGAQLKNVMFICALFTGISSGLLPPLLVNCFPTKIRYTGIAASYNVSFTLFGGLAPLISTLLVRESGQATGPAIYVIIVACISLVALLFRWPDQYLQMKKQAGG